MGQITIRFHYVANPRPVAERLMLQTKKNFEEVPEKALKGRALSHQSTSVDSSFLVNRADMITVFVRQHPQQQSRSFTPTIWIPLRSPLRHSTSNIDPEVRMHKH
jgi:hypothetical protein